MASDAVIAQLRSALTKSIQSAELNKAWEQSSNATTGLTFYNLEAPAKTLYPVLTPLRNAIPRVVVQNGGIQANWKAVLGVNTSHLSPGLMEGMRGSIISSKTADYLAAFRSIGYDDYVSFEAQLAGQGFEDVRARATRGLLDALMLGEEELIVGGNTGYALGQTPTPVVATSTTGGSIASGATVSVICVALTFEGAQLAKSDGQVAQTITKGSAGPGGSTTYDGGAAIKSAAASVTAGTGATNSVAASITPVRGAFGYAWFVGASGSERFLAVTERSSVSITALPSGTQEASALDAVDHSRNGLIFDGLLTMAANPANNAYWKDMPVGDAGVGTGLTGDGSGGIEEFDELLQNRWDKYRISPDHMWMSSDVMRFIRKKVLTATANSAQRFVFTANQPGLLGGSRIEAYTNPFALGGAKQIALDVHPNLPPGSVLFTAESIPYKLSGVTVVTRILCRQEYYQVEWPRMQRRYDYGVYADEVLQHYFPPSLAVINGIAPQ